MTPHEESEPYPPESQIDPSLATVDPRAKRCRGVTIVEAVVACGIIGLLSAVSLSIAVETTQFVRFTDAEYQAQTEATRAFDRTTELLRECGWNAIGPDMFPMVGGGGDSVTFNQLADHDGNGFAFDAATGEVEWSATTYRIARNDERELWVYDAADREVYLLGRFVDAVRFSTVSEDSTLHFKEIVVQITTSLTDADGNALPYTLQGSVHMRN